MRESPAVSYHGVVLHEWRVDGMRLFEAAYPAGLTIPTHRHRNFGLSLLLSGESRERYADAELACARGHLKVQPADVSHGNSYGVAGARLFVAELDAGWVQRMGSQADGLRIPRVLRHPQLELAMVRLRHASRTADVAAPATIEALLRELVVRVTAPARARRAGPEQWLRATRDHLHAHFGSTIRLDELANRAGVHPMHLAAAFRGRYGLSVGRYLRAIRIMEACRRLSETDEPLGRVAVATGFSNQPHLTRFFSRSVGVTPARFRRAFRRDQVVRDPFGS